MLCVGFPNCKAGTIEASKQVARTRAFLCSDTGVFSGAKKAGIDNEYTRATAAGENSQGD